MRLAWDVPGTTVECHSRDIYCNSWINIHRECLPAARPLSLICLHTLYMGWLLPRLRAICSLIIFFPVTVTQFHRIQPNTWTVFHSELCLQGTKTISNVFFSTGLLSESHQSLASGRRWLISGTPAKAWQLKPKAMCLLSNWNRAVRVWIQRGCQSAGAGDGVSDSVVACPMSLWNYKSTACYPKCITSLGHNCLLTNSWHLLSYACEYKAAESNNQTVSIPTFFFIVPRHRMWLQGILMEEKWVLPISYTLLACLCYICMILFSRHCSILCW